jgi:hypothetical protein
MAILAGSAINIRNGAYTVPAGANRVLLLFCSRESTLSTNRTLSFGGVACEKVSEFQGDGMSTSLFMLREASIPTGSQNHTTVDDQGTSDPVIIAYTLSDIDQTTPVFAGSLSAISYTAITNLSGTVPTDGTDTLVHISGVFGSRIVNGATGDLVIGMAEGGQFASAVLQGSNIPSPQASWAANAGGSQNGAIVSLSLNALASGPSEAYVLTAHGIPQANSVMEGNQFATTGPVYFDITGGDTNIANPDWPSINVAQLWLTDISDIPAFNPLVVGSVTYTIAYRVSEGGATGTFQRTVNVVASAVVAANDNWRFFVAATTAPKIWEWGKRHPTTNARVRMFKKDQA